MDDETALKRLKLLAKEDGALKIILPFHACAEVDAERRPAGLTDAMVAESEELREACAAFAAEHGHTPGQPGGYRDPGHYRLADVARIEETDKPGWYAAYADDDLGSVCAGRPADLLRRLTEHERA